MLEGWWIRETFRRVVRLGSLKSLVASLSSIQLKVESERKKAKSTATRVRVSRTSSSFGCMVNDNKKYQLHNLWKIRIHFLVLIIAIL